MAIHSRYWVVSPNVKYDRTKNQESVKQWRDVICRDRVAIMGWSPEDYEHGHGVGPKFAHELRMGDILLIARRHDWEPDAVALGVVRSKLKEENKYREIYAEGPVFVRKLRPFVPIHVPPSVPIIEVLKCTWAMHELHPERQGHNYDSHRKVCSWINQQLQLTRNDGNSLRITNKPLDKPLDKPDGEQTYDYEVMTKNQVRAARRKEQELLDNYRRWLEKQGRKLSRLQIGQMQCDAWGGCVP